MAFQETTATRKILSLNKRIRAVSGGTWASKTISILSWIIDYAQTGKNESITIVAESFPHLQLGAIRDFQNIMQSNGYWDDECWNESKHIYTFPSGCFVEFISFDKFGKAHGPRRDVLFINEANNIPYAIADQLITRTRKIVWMDWNPSDEFWFYTEMLPNRDDIDFITLTYRDNEALDDIARKEIESHKHDARWWRVYGEGLLGEPEGRIYTGWQHLDELPHEARLERRGIDFGYFPDPTAIVDVYYYNGGYILDEVLYAKGMRNDEIAGALKNLPKVLAIADSAEPKSIDDIKMYGISIIGAQKGPDSVRFGVKTVQGLQISVTKRSLNLIKEYRNYFQAYDKRTNLPIIGEYEGTCHALDAARYALCSLIPIIKRKEMIANLPKIPPTQRSQIAL